MLSLKTFVLCGTAVVVGLGTTPSPGQATRPVVPATVPADVSVPTTAAEVRALYDRFEKGTRNIPRDRFDPAAVVEAAGRDADALLAWVRDQTDPLPYRGCLKGSVGVLMDRGGNSLDRSLLLAELLQSVGHEVRLANATLPPAQAQQVLAASSKPRRHAAAASNGPAAAEARRRAAAQADRLLAALGGAAAAPAAAAADADAVAAVADHWWVQRKQGDRWADADPSGLSGLTPARTVTPSLPGGKPVLAAADYHEVELRVVIEVFRGGKLIAEPVLKHTFRPAETIGWSIGFSHTLGSFIPDADLADEPAARKRLRAQLVAQETFLPTLRINGRAYIDASFTTDGTIDRSPKMDPAGKLGGKVADAFGGLVGGGGDDGPKGVLTAEWVEYEVRSPGRPAAVVRRPVFDLIGPSARAAGVTTAPVLDDRAKLDRALRLASDAHLTLQPCDVPAAYVLYAEARAELRDKDYWVAAAEPGPRAAEMTLRGLERLEGRDPSGPMFAVHRAAAAARPGATFVDRPNIVHHHVWLEAAAAGDEIARRRGMDLAFTSTAGLGGGADAFAARVRQGVADTLAEHLALGGNAAAGENTVGVFEAAAAAPAVLRPADAAAAGAAVQKLAARPDVAERVRADLAAGHVVVLAAGPGGRQSWWRVDPATGQTVGVMDTGYHAALTEQEAQYEKQFKNFVPRLKRQIDKDEFLKMKNRQLKDLTDDSNLLENLQGLHKDWNGLLQFRSGRASFIAG